MRHLLFSLLGLFPFLLLAQGPHCIQGRVLDEGGQEPLIGASILIEGSTHGTVSDIDGNFTICHPDSLETFSIQVSYTGYEKKLLANIQKTDQPLQVIMTHGSALEEVVVTGYKVPLIQQDNTSQISNIRSESMGLSAQKQKRQRNSYPRHPEPQQRPEQYNAINENGLQKTKKAPISTLSTDVDRAAYANVRRFLNEGQQPPADAVRIEEMINYFRYNDPLPKGEDPVALRSELSECPWNPEHQLLRIGVRARGMAKSSAPAANLVFLLDVSGSMSSPDRLPMIKSAMQALALTLRAEDKVSIVVYAGAAGLVLPPTPGDNHAKIIDALQELQAGGSTAGGQGIELAYKIAEENFLPKGNNRIILATDGDFNVGISQQEDLIKLIEAKRESGVFLTILGAGRGNYQEGTMQMLANKGNGNHAYLDNLNEARKVLIDELGGTLYTVAKDVKLQITFDEKSVEAYRLVGYENRLLATEDFDDDTKDAAEMGAGHVVTVLYEIVPAKKVEKGQAIGQISLRYKQPQGKKSQLLEWELSSKVHTFEQASIDLRWASAVATFGLLLRDSPHKSQANYPQLLEIAEAAKGRDPFGYRAEMIGLIKKAMQH